MKRFSLLSAVLLSPFVVSCADSTAPSNLLLLPPSAPVFAASPGNSPPPPVDAFVDGQVDGISFAADGTYFSNEESVQAGIALGALTVASSEEKSHAWLKLDDLTNPPVFDISPSAQIKRQGLRLSGNGTITIGGGAIVIRIDEVTSFESSPDCATSRLCGTITFTASISRNGGPFTPAANPGTMVIFNDDFLGCGEICECQPTNCG